MKDQNVALITMYICTWGKIVKYQNVITTSVY